MDPVGVWVWMFTPLGLIHQGDLFLGVGRQGPHTPLGNQSLSILRLRLPTLIVLIATDVIAASLILAGG